MNAKLVELAICYFYLKDQESELLIGLLQFILITFLEVIFGRVFLIFLKTFHPEILQGESVMVFKDVTKKELKVSFLFNFLWFLLITLITIYSSLFLQETCENFDEFLETFGDIKEFKISHPTKKGYSMMFALLSLYTSLSFLTVFPFLSITLLNCFIFGCKQCCGKKVGTELFESREKFSKLYN